MKLNLQKKCDYHIFLLLRQKINGYDDIVKKIINIKNEDLLNRDREYHIENDFYNWLNCDIQLRNKASLNNSVIPQYQYEYIYYSKNHKKLGLEPLDYTNIYDCLRRTTGLNECFKSKWWKSTIKNRTEWKIIHKSINMNEPLYIWTLDKEYTSDDIINVENNNWRKPNFIEQCRVNNKICYYKEVIKIDIHELFINKILLTPDLKLIIN